MRIVWQKGINKTFLFLLIVIGFTACEEYNEGCMDANATNYNFAYEKPCCCVYPRMIFQTPLRLDNANFSTSDTLYTDNDEGYLIGEINFIANEINLTRKDGSIAQPTDSLIDYLVDSDVMPVKITKINSNGANYLENDSIKQIDFTISSNTGLNQYQPADFPVDHVFRDSTLYDFTNNEWRYLYISLRPVGGSTISLSFTPSELDIPTTIQGSWGKSKGNNLTLLFYLHIDELFKGISLSDPTSTLKAKIIENFPNALKI
ncbi:hypothetical protein [Membranihabitans marinus]|uniref:hypothetical protein n=1 Tax=Membranihabitans marinus TaxID=1227546 RepID=UPI001F294BB3|nr:hypothetical protein [Membranihabitans marinus]